MSAAVEDRLREALAARAGQVTAGDLQPAAPPSRSAATAGRRPMWVPALAGLAVAIVFVVMLAWRLPQPAMPGNAPTPSGPTLAPSGPTLVPSPAEPSPAAPTSPAQPAARSTARSPVHPSRNTGAPRSTREPTTNSPRATGPTHVPTPSAARATTEAPVPATASPRSS